MCPWLPEDFFHRLLSLWSERLEEDYELLLNFRSSGPTKRDFESGVDAFSSGLAEAGIICAPTYLWGRTPTPPRIELAGFTPVFEDLTTPVYYSVVLVRQDSGFEKLADLAEARWAFNDPCSLSGYFSVTSSLPQNKARIQELATFTGGHFQSVELLLNGGADACAVDSNGWLLQKALHKKSEGKLKALTRLGPFVAQPLVLATRTAPERKLRLKKTLEDLSQDKDALLELQRKWGLVRFVATNEEHFDLLKSQMS